MSAIATPKAVFNAANELHATGQPVTIDTVIAKINGGSKSTVGPLLEASHSTVKTSTEALPQALEARARELVTVIWHEAMCKLEPRILAAQQEFDVQLRARDAVVDHTLEPIRKLESEVQRMQSLLESEQVRCAGLMALVHKNAEASRELERQTAAAAQAREDCAEHERTSIRVQAENAVLREQLALFAPSRRRRSVNGNVQRNSPASTASQ
jgi:hypothetical protein